jgi:DNA-binding CsgD family transcriptional regulator
MLAVVILSPTLSSVFHGQYFGPDQKPITVHAIGLTIDLLTLFICALLGANRIRALVAAAFVFSITYLIEIPIIYYIGVVVHPLLSMSNVIEIAYQFPQLYYCAVILNNAFLMCCCFLAARWLCKTQTNTPKKLSVIFICFFCLFTIIILFWWKDIVMIMPPSFLASAFLGTLLVGILILALYFFSRLTANKAPATYAQFIPNLSKRELEVIEAVLAGYISQKELADSLNISVNTVKTHLKNIYQTIGVSSIDALSLIFHGYTPNHPDITPKSPKR